MRALLLALVVLAAVAYSQAQSNFTGPDCFARYVNGCQQELNTCLDWNSRPACNCYGI